jgi:putative transposase
MIAFIDDHCGAYGVEPICRVLPIAPSTYYDHVARPRDPSRRSARAKRDEALKREVRRVFEENYRVYGVHGASCSRASRTKSACAVRLTRQPTMRRA